MSRNDSAPWGTRKAPRWQICWPASCLDLQICTFISGFLLFFLSYANNFWRALWNCGWGSAKEGNLEDGNSDGCSTNSLIVRCFRSRRSFFHYNAREIKKFIMLALIMRGLVWKRSTNVMIHEGAISIGNRHRICISSLLKGIKKLIMWPLIIAFDSLLKKKSGHQSNYKFFSFFLTVYW